MEISTVTKLGALGVDRLTAIESSQEDTENKEDLTQVVFYLRTLLDQATQRKCARHVLDSLYFAELHDRKFSMNDAHVMTYDWIFGSCQVCTYKDVKYIDWLTRGSDTYWISDKAGSGKSTLMKLIHSHERTKSASSVWAHGKHLVIASHFFWSGGMEIPMSLLSLLQSLLYQVRNQCRNTVAQACLSRLQSEQIHLTPWTTEELLASFERLATQDLQPLIFASSIEIAFEIFEETYCPFLMEGFKLCAHVKLWVTISSRLGHPGICAPSRRIRCLSI